MNSRKVISIAEAIELQALPIKELANRVDIAHAEGEWLRCSLICSILARKSAAVTVGYMRKAVAEHKLSQQSDMQDNDED